MSRSSPSGSSQRLAAVELVACTHLLLDPSVPVMGVIGQPATQCYLSGWVVGGKHSLNQ